MTVEPRDVVMLFDGSFDGFLSVVYDVYYERLEPAGIVDESGGQLTIDCLPYIVSTDAVKADKVLAGIGEKVSFEAAARVYHAFLTPDEGRFMVLLGYIRMGFRLGHMVDNYMRDDTVLRVHNLAKQTCRESHLLLGFCRFSETKQGVFYCPITPRNDVLPIVAEHFSQRLMNQAWVIHDKTRNQAAVFDGRKYVIADVPRDVSFDLADGEEETRELWIRFFDSLTIQARMNKKVQRQLLPLYFRSNMTEFTRR